MKEYWDVQLMTSRRAPDSGLQSMKSTGLEAETIIGGGMVMSARTASLRPSCITCHSRGRVEHYKRGFAVSADVKEKRNKLDGQKKR